MIADTYIQYTEDDKRTKQVHGQLDRRGTGRTDRQMARLGLHAHRDTLTQLFSQRSRVTNASPRLKLLAV